VILNELLEYASNKFTNSVFGFLLMIAIYECSCDILALKSLLKILDCDGPKCQQLIPFILGQRLWLTKEQSFRSQLQVIHENEQP
jgi:hypothetical protein